MIHNVTSTEEFSEILASNPDVLMEFYAAWCPHCKAFQPNLEAASETLSENGVFTAQTEIDAFEDLAGQYGVESIPTIIFFKNGQPVLESTGERDPQGVLEFVAEAQNR